MEVGSISWAGLLVILLFLLSTLRVSRALLSLL